MEFSRLTLDKIDILKPYFTDNQCRICDYTMGGTFMWRDYHSTEYAIEDGILYLKVAYPSPAFAPPRAEGTGTVEGKAAYEKIIEYCLTAGIAAQICSVSAPVLEDIQVMYPGAKAQTDRAWSDYLYSSEDILTLAGRKYSGQRNHINRFEREHPVWSFESVTKDNIGAVLAFFRKYSQEHIKDYPAYTEGNVKAIEVLENWDAYGQSGGVLLVSGEVAGASIGETVGDTLYIHVEKASSEINGSYPMLMNQFANMYVTDSVKYINREEDDGVEGLRVSKMSYHPLSILDKYCVYLP